MKKSAWILILLFTLVKCKKENDNPVPSDPVEIKDTTLVANLALPWELLWGPDNHIWMTEKGGKISRVDTASGSVTPVYTLPDAQVNGEGGLLGMVLDPGFSSNKYVYLVYDYNKGGTYTEKVVRFTYNGTTLTNPFTLIDDIKAASIHNGSRLLVQDGKIYITTGDANDQALPQNKSALNGKILRLNLDGSIPSDNPIAGNPVWSFGHRNPQGLVFANNMLYSSEHGPSTDDEINIIEKGVNYGWPNVHGFCDPGSEQSFCNAENVREPIYAWTPTIATSGLDYYDNDRIPQWKNSLLLATLKNSRVYQLKLSSDHRSVEEVNEYFTNKYGRVRDFCISPDGKVYFCTSNGGNDRIVVVDKR